MRILIFHGYLLRGTGSNVYNASLTRALRSQGHEVALFCQDRSAAELPFVDAVGRFDGDRLSTETVRSPARVTVYLPDIGTTLPVYVADRYEGFDAVPFPQLSEEALERYLAANVAAVREVAGRWRPAVALANHLVMGPVILARALAGEVGYAVKVHGSALEYTVRPHRERFLPFAQEGLAGAAGVLVGSRHTGTSLLEVAGNEPSLAAKLRLGPPGVDTDAFRPLSADAARTALVELAGRLAERPTAWGGEQGASGALLSLDPRRERIVSYVGKLIVSKGIDLLVAAWPLVAAAAPDARLCIVGFGTYRDAVSALVDALAARDLDAARRIAARGRELEGGPPGALNHLCAFLERVAGGEHPGYLDTAAVAAGRIHFTGRLEHEELPPLLAASLAQVVPSTFPEAFGMVAVEAAACGALPVSAAHSGLAEVSARLAPALPPEHRQLLSFERGPYAVEQIAERLTTWLALDPQTRDRERAALSASARETFGWDGVARWVIAAAEGDLDALPALQP